MLGRRAVIVFLGLLLAGCAVSETRSIVDKEHLPATKYQKVALFIEGVDEPERTAAEQIVLSTFQSAGLNTESALAFFAKRGQLSDQAKASIIQKQFDAVLYLKVVQKGIAEELVPNARSDGQYIVYKLGIVNFGAEIPEGLIIKPDGSVYKPSLALHTTVDFQDTKTAQQVWTSETVSSGSPQLINMRELN